jgi:hypothetical protein
MLLRGYFPSVDYFPTSSVDWPVFDIDVSHLQ